MHPEGVVVLLRDLTTADAAVAIAVGEDHPVVAQVILEVVVVSCIYLQRSQLRFEILLIGEMMISSSPKSKRKFFLTVPRILFTFIALKASPIYIFIP